MKKVCELTFAFFDEGIVGLEDKERIEMKREKSFLGWSRVSLNFLCILQLFGDFVCVMFSTVSSNL